MMISNRSDSISFCSIHKSILIFIIFFLVPGLQINQAQANVNAQEILDHALYKRGFENISLSVSLDRFDFIIDNFTYIVDILVQSDPHFFRNNFEGKFYSYEVSGSPQDFLVNSYNNSAKVKMYRSGDEEIFYVAEAETRKLKIPVTGDIVIKMQLNRSDNNRNNIPTMDLIVAFKPKSAVVEIAMKPILMLFSDHVDDFMDKVFTSADDFFLAIDQVIHKALTNKNIIYLLASLYQENQLLKAEISGNDKKIEHQATGSKSKPKKSESYGLNIVIVFISLIFGAMIGILSFYLIVSLRKEQSKKGAQYEN